MGQRVRAQRMAVGLSLTEVSSRSGLSIGYLSQLERGISSATLRALTSLSDVLGVSLATLLAPEPKGSAPSDSLVRKARSHQVTLWGSGIRKSLLAGHGLPGASGSFTLLRMTLVSGADSGQELYAHAGYEAGYVEKGSICLTIAGQDHALQEGDSFQFPSTEPHRFRNATAKPAVIVLLNLKGPQRTQVLGG